MNNQTTNGKYWYGRLRKVWHGVLEIYEKKSKNKIYQQIRNFSSKVNFLHWFNGMISFDEVAISWKVAGSPLWKLSSRALPCSNRSSTRERKSRISVQIKLTNNHVLEVGATSLSISSLAKWCFSNIDYPSTAAKLAKLVSSSLVLFDAFCNSFNKCQQQPPSFITRIMWLARND